MIVKGGFVHVAFALIKRITIIFFELHLPYKHCPQSSEPSYSAVSSLISVVCIFHTALSSVRFCVLFNHSLDSIFSQVPVGSFDFLILKPSFPTFAAFGTSGCAYNLLSILTGFICFGNGS